MLDKPSPISHLTSNLASLANLQEWWCSKTNYQDVCNTLLIGEQIIYLYFYLISLVDFNGGKKAGRREGMPQDDNFKGYHISVQLGRKSWPDETTFYTWPGTFY